MRLVVTIQEQSQSKFERLLSGWIKLEYNLLSCGFDGVAGWWAIFSRDVPDSDPRAEEDRAEEEIEQMLADTCTRCTHNAQPPPGQPDPCLECLQGINLTNFEEGVLT